MKKDIKSFQVQIILMLILSIIHISVTVYFFFHGFRLNENRNRPICKRTLYSVEQIVKKKSKSSLKSVKQPYTNTFKTATI